MDAILETAFNDRTGDWAPVSNWTQQTLTLKGQLPDIRAKMEAGGLISTLSPSFFFPFSTLSCSGDYALPCACGEWQQ